jgi:hypothetical protein
MRPPHHRPPSHGFGGYTSDRGRDRSHSFARPRRIASPVRQQFLSGRSRDRIIVHTMWKRPGTSKSIATTRTETARHGFSPAPARRPTRPKCAMFDKGPRERLSSEGKTNSLTRMRPMSSSNLAAASLNGTRCSRPAFMRAAGIVHTREPRSISSHVAPRTSFVRQPVRIANASALAAMPPSRSRKRAMKAGTSA